MAKCNGCGAELTGTGKFCSECGTSQERVGSGSVKRLSGIDLTGGSIGFTLDISSGEILFNNRFVIDSRIGSGGFGEVYLAHDQDANHQVALKIVPTEQGEEETAAEQLRNEINLRRKINNFEHIIRVNDLYVDSNYKGLPLVLLSMEYADGGNLKNWIAENIHFIKQEDKRTESLKYFKDACLGVKAIHDAGLIHLDLKPENLLVMEGQAKVSDLGLSRNYIQYAQNPDKILQEWGTPSYMSPEQFESARQRDINHQSDIYTLGIILFELLDGLVPYDGSFDELKEKHLTYQPPSLRGDLAPWGKMVERCLAKDPSQRYTSVDDLLVDLDSADRGDALSVDVACHKCGHINVNKDLKKCEQCGEDISDLFRRCPNCQRLNRLDVDICPPENLGCGYDVGRHYRIEDLLKKAHELRDVDPLEAIRALVAVLDLDRGNREAKEMLPGLRNVQEKIEGIIPKAEAAEKKGLLEDARGRWQDVLSLSPRHRVATAKKQELDGLIERYNSDYERSLVLMDQGKFVQARGLLEGCRELIPARKETDDALIELNRREQSYNQHFEKAKSWNHQKKLKSSKKELELSLEEAPKSLDVSKLKTEVKKKIAKADGLFVAAKDLLDRAEFEKVRLNISQIEGIQADISRFQSFTKDVQEKEDKYTNLSVKWTDALKPEVRDLNKAQKNLEEALKICPKCPEVRTLKQLIEDKAEAIRLIEEAKLSNNAAEFTTAKDKIGKAESIWRKVPQLSAVKERLKTTQPHYTKHFNTAEKLYGEKDLAAALAEIQAALAICPVSKESKKLENKITSNQKKAISLIQKAWIQISKADFIQAKISIEVIRNIWPKAEGLAQVDNDLNKTKANYENFFNKAKKLYDPKKDLELALKNAVKALRICEGSEEAQRLFDKIKADQIKAIDNIKGASSSISRAAFSSAKDQLDRAKTLWPDEPNLNSAERELEEKEKKYGLYYKDATELFKKKKKLNVALDRVDDALNLCPHSLEALDLKDKINGGLERWRKDVRQERIMWVTMSVALLTVASIMVGGHFFSHRENKKMSLLNSGSLYIETDPKDARIKILNNNIKYRHGINLAPGRYRISVSAPGYLEKEDWVNVNEKKANTYKFQLRLAKKDPRPYTAILYVKTKPKNARIRILNIGPKYRPGIELKPGKYHIEVSAQGHKTQKLWVELPAGVSKTLSFQLVSLTKSSPKTPENNKVQIAWKEYKTGNYKSAYEKFRKEKGQFPKGSKDWQSCVIGEVQCLIEFNKDKQALSLINEVLDADYFRSMAVLRTLNHHKVHIQEKLGTRSYENSKIYKGRIGKYLSGGSMGSEYSFRTDSGQKLSFLYGSGTIGFDNVKEGAMVKIYLDCSRGACWAQKVVKISK